MTMLDQLPVKNCARFVLVAVLLALASCASVNAGKNASAGTAATATPEDYAAPESVVNYRCGYDDRMQITLRGAERAQLKYAGAATELHAVRSSSGAKFESPDGKLVFWSKGTEATVDNGSGTTMHCKVIE